MQVDHLNRCTIFIPSSFFLNKKVVVNLGFTSKTYLRLKVGEHHTVVVKLVTCKMWKLNSHGFFLNSTVPVSSVLVDTS
jgi:hypothetical protein